MSSAAAMDLHSLQDAVKSLFYAECLSNRPLPGRMRRHGKRRALHAPGRQNRPSDCASAAMSARISSPGL